LKHLEVEVAEHVISTEASVAEIEGKRMVREREKRDRRRMKKKLGRSI
jgi:hypothetical protein